MLELAVSVAVGAVSVLIYIRYRNVFSLPFFWVAYFLLQYLGFLQIRSRYGGHSYIYAAAGFGVFYLGLVATDLIPRLHKARRSNVPRSHLARRSVVGHAGTRRKPWRTKIDLMFPPLPLYVGLFVSIFGAIIVSLAFFAQNGLPILESFPALAWVKSTSGLVNRLMTVFGAGTFASLGLVAWAVHRETKSRAAHIMMYVGLGLAILAQSLLATKAAAIQVFLWFNIVLFYLNKKREYRKSVLPLLLVVVPVSAAIVAVRSMSSRGYWGAEGIYETYYTRLTTTTAGPEDFIFTYMGRFGRMHGRGMLRELRRIREQLTGASRTPILSELVYDLMNGLSPNETGLSATLTVGGAGYIEWGMAGLLAYSLLQGLAFGWIHRRLFLRKKEMNLVALLLWGAVIGYVMSVSTSGSVLIGLEGIALGAIPPLAMLLPFCGIFALPLRWKYRVPPHIEVRLNPKNSAASVRPTAGGPTDAN